MSPKGVCEAITGWVLVLVSGPFEGLYSSSALSEVALWRQIDNVCAFGAYKALRLGELFSSRAAEKGTWRSPVAHCKLLVAKGLSCVHASLLLAMAVH